MSTYRVYTAMKKFTDARAAARDQYIKTMGPLETAAGSKYWTDEEAKAAKLRRDTVEEARRICNAELKEAFSEMTEANHRRVMPAPTDCPWLP